MKLSELLYVLPEFKNQSEFAQSAEVLGLTATLSEVQPGFVFVAIRGTKFDTHTKLSEACDKGAIALVVEEASVVPKGFTGFIQVVPKTREALDALASQYYSHPSLRMLMFGVTGTNGKTSCTYLLEHILNYSRLGTGVLGTINHHLHDRVWKTEMTTPGPLELQKRLFEMYEAGAKAIAMEVSSHALHQHRADGVHFNTTLFTNLTRDHLDYHKTMDAYWQAKERLFTDLLWKSQKRPKFAIINSDDEFGKKMNVCGEAIVWTYGQSEKADFSFQVERMDFAKTHFKLKSPFGVFRAEIPLAGLHNVYNAVGVLASAASFGVKLETALQALESFKGVPGRLERVSLESTKNVFVDYAHTPDALENVLSSLKKIKAETKSSGQILTLFGCGGDRDPGKRPLMAAISEKYSDRVIVTSDNPRTEDPEVIIQQIIAGFSTHANPVFRVEVDREKAIRSAIQQMSSGDVLLIAGKGHEDYQIIGTEKRPFSDFAVALSCLQGEKQ